MTFARILGQDSAVGTLRRAIASDRVHHAYRFEGPDGVGKEMAAFAFAQALLCERRGPGESDGCGACSACQRAVTFSTGDPRVPLHPDVILIERGLYKGSLIGRSTDEVKDISVNQVDRVAIAPLTYPPHESRGRVIIFRRAEELSVAAANRLLKTLEEPPKATHFVLLTSRGRELLDTIRSRAQCVRFGALPDSVVATLLRERGVKGDALDAAVSFGAGSASAAVAAADVEASTERAEFLESIWRAIEASDASVALAVAQARDKDKDVLQERLVALGADIARKGRELAPSSTEEARRAAERFRIVMTALRELDRNAAPQLLLEAMLLRMRALA